MLINEKYYVTSPMVLSQKNKIFECNIVLKKENIIDEKFFLDIHKNEILECLMQGNIFVKSVEENQKGIFFENISYITLSATHLDVSLKSNSAKIIVYRD